MNAAGEHVERYTYDPYGKVFIEKWDAAANGGAGAWAASETDCGSSTCGKLPVSSVGKAAQDKTFLMTNMCPQVPGLNQRGWEALEGIISESWAEEFGELWVIAGPIFDNSASAPCKELPSDVRVPTHCYMVIVDVTDDNEPRALGVIMPNVRIDRQPLRPFVKTVDEIETLTGIDFLPAMADGVEDQIEAADANHASADWHIDHDLIPTFPGTARAIHVNDCD